MIKINLITCLSFCLIYLIGLGWIILGICYVTGTTTVLFRKSAPYWIFVTFAIINIIMAGGGCFILESNFLNNRINYIDERLPNRCSGLQIYRIISILGGICIIIVSSVYLTWQFIYITAVVYFVLMKVIFWDIHAHSVGDSHRPLMTQRTYGAQGAQGHREQDVLPVLAIAPYQSMPTITN